MPIQKLYDYYKGIGKLHEDAYDRVSKDAGCLLARVLDDDLRKFEIVGKDTGNCIS